MSTDISSLCRICLKNCKGRGRRSEYIYDGSDPERPSLHSMLVSICAAVFDDSSDDKDQKTSKASFGLMPKSVCIGCKQKVVAAYDLHQACIEADRRLWEMITKQKQELEDSKATDAAGEPLDAMDVLYLKQELDEDTPNDDPVEADKSDLEDVETKKEVEAVDEDQDGSKVEHRSGDQDAGTRTCEICSKVFRKSQQIQAHLKATHADQIKPCDQCDEVFLSDVKLEDHKMYHETGKRYSCDICKKRLKSLYSLRLHVRSHGNYDEFKCAICSKNFASSKLLRQHMLKHNGEKKFVCELCPMRFSSKGCLKTHMLTHTKLKKHLCDICGKNFSMNTSLVRHKRMHHSGGGEVRPHVCTHCGAGFKNTYSLKRHIRTHTGEKPYQCAYCDRAYAQCNDLVKHTRTHVGDKPYKCDLCESSFRFMAELRDHYTVHAQPSDKNELSELSKQHLEKYAKGPKFTSTAVLSRRFEQEMHQQEQPDGRFAS